jgi:uncharacterized HAD superfamily protein
MVANVVALHLNKPLTALNEFLEGRVLSSGRRLDDRPPVSVASANKIVVVDDSIATGYEMRRTRALVEAAGLGHKVIYLAAYASDETWREVDIYFEICPMPRLFAWNLMHRQGLANACVDIDGVLCVDPTEQENDDGPLYKRFLSTAKPLLRPTCEIGTLVTCRLERYRSETESWLREQDVRYRDLVMWDLPSKAARIARGGHAEFKASVYRSLTSSEVFIESSAAQAQVIAKTAFKPVVCVETQRIYHADTRELLLGAARNSPKWISKGMKHLLVRMCRAR